jgi:hypothetical protein
MIGFRRWSAQEVGENTLLAKSAAEATWFARLKTTAANSPNTPSHYDPPTILLQQKRVFPSVL